MNQEKIGKFISELRKEKGYTQNELANLVNLSDKAVSKWETGKSVPDYSVLEPLSKALDVSVTELLNGERNPNLVGDTVVDQIKFYNKRTANKFKKIIFILSIIILCIVTLILGVYVINNFNTCKLYSLKSADENYIVNGNIIYTKSNNVLMIGDIKIRNTNNANDKKIIGYEYAFIGDGATIKKTGDILSFEEDSVKLSKSIIDCLAEIKVYIDFNLENIDFEKNLSKKLELKIDLMDDDYNIKTIIIPLSINKVFSNNQLIYSS